MGQGKLQIFLFHETAIKIAHEAGFDFHFGSLDGKETELSKMYGGLLQVFQLFVHSTSWFVALTSSDLTP
jgi:hypothetical protein